MSVCQEPVAGPHRQRGAVPLGDERMHHVERRHAAGAGHPVAVDHVTRAAQRQIGKFLGKGLRMFPVDGHAVAGHDAGAGKDERPTRDAAHAHASLRQAPEPGEGGAMDELGRVAAGADEEQIEIEIVADPRRAGQCRAAGGHDDRLLMRDVHPAIEFAPDEMIGGAQGLDRRGVGHQRQPWDDQKADGLG